MNNRLYESLMAGIEAGIREGIGVVNEGAPAEPELRQTRRGRGRPRKSQKLSNLYRPVDNAPISGMSPERVIQAFAVTAINKAGQTLYMDDLQDVTKFRSYIINAINKASEHYAVDKDQLMKEYNLEDLDSFAQDIRDHYDELRGMRNFPTLVKKVSPIIRTKKRGRRKMTDEEIEQVACYFADFGRGIPVDSLRVTDLRQLAEHKLTKDGAVYEVVRPIRSGMEDAPHLMYKRTGKFGQYGGNILRQCYRYQCEYEFSQEVDYMYVSSVVLSRYLEYEYGK